MEAFALNWAERLLRAHPLLPGRRLQARTFHAQAACFVLWIKDGGGGTMATIHALQALGGLWREGEGRCFPRGPTRDTASKARM